MEQTQIETLINFGDVLFKMKNANEFKLLTVFALQNQMVHLITRAWTIMQDLMHNLNQKSLHLQSSTNQYQVQLNYIYHFTPMGNL